MSSPDKSDTLISLEVTCSNADEARAIGREIITQRLAACVHIEDAITSLFVWEGAVSEEQEVLLRIKTCLHHLDALRQLIHKHHSYTLPALFWHEMNTPDAALRDWVRESVALQ